MMRDADFRAKKIRQMRALIARGELETEERINETVRRLVAELESAESTSKKNA